MASRVSDSDWILYVTNLALFSAEELSANYQQIMGRLLFICLGEITNPCLLLSPVPGVVLPPRAVVQCAWELLSFTLCEECLNFLGQSLTTSSHKESASTTNDSCCFSSVSSSWSVSLFRMISIPWVFMNKALWQSFLPFVTRYVLCAVRPWCSKWSQDEVKETP